jgi:hypothetical protein
MNCLYCDRESNEKICDECWEPIDQYLKDGGTLREYMRAFMQSLAKKVVDAVAETLAEELKRTSKKETAP